MSGAQHGRPNGGSAPGRQSPQKAHGRCRATDSPWLVTGDAACLDEGIQCGPLQADVLSQLHVGDASLRYEAADESFAGSEVVPGLCHGQQFVDGAPVGMAVWAAAGHVIPPQPGA